jgi:hypothetical protein
MPPALGRRQVQPGFLAIIGLLLVALMHNAAGESST